MTREEEEIVARRAPIVAGILADELPSATAPKAADAVHTENRRQPRSDNGKPKPKKQPEATPGTLTGSQVNHIIFLTKQLQEATSRYDRADRLLVEAVKEHADYLDSLKGA